MKQIPVSHLPQSCSNLSVDTTLVSVITPVYGISARILTETLDSLVAQDLAEAEFLLVNDASPDSHTAELLAQYVQRDPRFRVFTHESNQGRSQARNRAIDEACGVYVVLFDADDLLSPNYCRVLAATADFYQADMVTAAIVKFRDGEHPSIVNQHKPEDFFRPNWKPGRGLVRQRFICRMFRRSVLGNLRFDADLYRGEDVLFIHAALLRCRITLSLDFPGYFYRVTCLDPVPPSAAEAGAIANRRIMAYHNTAQMICKFALLARECNDKRERSFIAYLVIRRFLRHIFSARRTKIKDCETRAILRTEWRRVNAVLRAEFSPEYPFLFRQIEWLLDGDAKWYEAPLVWLMRGGFELRNLSFGAAKIIGGLRLKKHGITC